MQVKNLPDVTSEFRDGGLGRLGRIKSGTFALIGFSPAPSKPYKITSIEGIKVLKASRLQDTVRDFFSYSSGTVYCYPIQLPSGKKTTFAPIKIDNSGFTVEIPKLNNKDQILYRDINVFEVEIDTKGTPGNATFIVRYGNGWTEATKKIEKVYGITSPRAFEKDKELDIEELGIKIKLKPDNDSSELAEGAKAKVSCTTEFTMKKEDFVDIHKKIANVQDIIEYFAYDFDTKSDFWVFLKSEYEKLSKDLKKEYFGVCRFRDLKLSENEKPPAYIAELKKERAKLPSNNRVLVLGQPATYLDSYGVKKKGKIPFGYFLAKLSSTEYYKSLNAVTYENRFQGIIDLGEFSLEHIKQIYSLSYTGFRYFEGFSGIYLTEAMLMTDDASDYDSVERIRVMNRASLVVRNALVSSFLNRNFPVSSISKDEGILVLIKEIVKKAFDRHLAGSFEDYEIEVKGLESILQTSEIQIVYKIIPLGKVRYITNIFSYALPKAS